MPTLANQSNKWYDATLPYDVKATHMDLYTVDCDNDLEFSAELDTGEALPSGITFDSSTGIFKIGRCDTNDQTQDDCNTEVPAA